MRFYASVLLLGLITIEPVFANQVEVVKVTVAKSGAQRYDFTVTLLHQDSGWEHYADKWEVVGSDGQIYATRTLLHPHVDEQPFTRALSNVPIPATVRAVILRAHDSVHGYGAKTITLTLP